MNQIILTCKKCGAEIELTDSLAAPLLEKAKGEFERKLAEKNTEINLQKEETEKRRSALEGAEEALDQTIAERVAAQMAKLSAAEAKKARDAVQSELNARDEELGNLKRSLAVTAEAEAKKARAAAKLELDKQKEALEDANIQLKAANEMLDQSKRTEADFIKRSRALEEEKRALELTVQQKVDKELEVSRANLRQEIELEVKKAKEAAENELKSKDDELEGLRRSLASTAEAEARKARAAAKLELDKQKEALEDANVQLRSANEMLEQSKRTEADFIKKSRALESEKRALELTVQQKVDKELDVSRVTLRRELEADVKMRLREKDIQLESMKMEIENLKRKSEQGSMQIQGDAQEQELAEILASKFPRDKISRVKKGEFGGDCVQQVYNRQGSLCGTILWESKRTQNWSPAWLSKLKSDQHAAKADVAIIVSQVLPKGVETFEQVDDVWVAGLGCVVPVAGSLRHLLIEVASTKRSTEGHQEKAALIYQYVTSVAFRQRVKEMSEAFTTMQFDLKVEQKAIRKQWAKREAQLDRIMDATTGMYGDLQGIAGKSVPELDGIGFDSLGSGS
jgi:hypothetical protein